MKKPQKTQKRFIVRKYIMASSVQEAVKKDKQHPVEDCWVDDEWKRLNDDIKRQIGF